MMTLFRFVALLAWTTLPVVAVLANDGDVDGDDIVLVATARAAPARLSPTATAPDRRR